MRGNIAETFELLFDKNGRAVHVSNGPAIFILFY